MKATKKKRLARQMMGAGVGLLLDRVFGEPPANVHPVACFGKAMTKLETFVWRGTKESGASYGLFGLSIAAAASQLVSSPFAGTAIGTYVAVAEKSLFENAFAIDSSLERGDLDSVRRQVPSLVGRDSNGLDAFGAARAVVESVAENSSDAVIAPMFYGAVLGGRGSLIYRAINTMDAMVGYKNLRYLDFGWFSARLDDFANYLPSRLAALLSWLVPTGRSASPGLILADSSRHPSPNAGVVEATYAHKLGIRLGGVNSYGGRAESRPEMGYGPCVSRSDINRAVELCRRSDTIFAAVLITAGALLELWPSPKR
ncbi:MAG: cobalamin biosynthesis protein CobD [Actinomycetota bacterium]|nr:MAG: cobalamin biosynthesis protein CobD [Actinomycetota bacterium]